MVLTTQVTWLLGKTGCFATFYKHSFGTLILNTSWVQKFIPTLPHPYFHTSTVFFLGLVLCCSRLHLVLFYRKTRWENLFWWLPQEVLDSAVHIWHITLLLVRKGSQLFSFIYASKNQLCLSVHFQSLCSINKTCHQAGNRHWEYWVPCLNALINRAHQDKILAYGWNQYNNFIWQLLITFFFLVKHRKLLKA